MEISKVNEENKGGKGNVEGKEEKDRYKYKLSGNVEEIKLLLESEFLMKIMNFINNNKIIKTQTKKDLQLKTIIKMNEFKSQYKLTHTSQVSGSPPGSTTTDEIDVYFTIKSPIIILPYFHPQYQRINVDNHALSSVDDKNHFLFIKFGDIQIINSKYHPDSLNACYFSFNHIVNPFHHSVDISPVSSAPSPFTSSYNVTVQNIQLFIFNSILPVRIFPFLLFPSSGSFPLIPFLSFLSSHSLPLIPFLSFPAHSLLSFFVKFYLLCSLLLPLVPSAYHVPSFHLSRNPFLINILPYVPMDSFLVYTADARVIYL